MSMQKIVAMQPSRKNEHTVPRKASRAWMETVSFYMGSNLYGQMQPNQVLGTVLLKLDELSRQRFLCGACL